MICRQYGALFSVSELEVKSHPEVHVACPHESSSKWLQVSEAISCHVILLVGATIVIFCVAVLVPRTSPLLNDSDFRVRKGRRSAARGRRASTVRSTSILGVSVAPPCSCPTAWYPQHGGFWDHVSGSAAATVPSQRRGDRLASNRSCGREVGAGLGITYACRHCDQAHAVG